jgi:hypothetical protein
VPTATVSVSRQTAANPGFGGVTTLLPGDPMHAPFEHVSGEVHALPSVQVVPFASNGSEHTPVPVLQVPRPWQATGAGQTTGFDPVHTPLWQVSVCVQAFPSTHVVLLGFAGFEHTPVPGLHVPASWH